MCYTVCIKQKEPVHEVFRVRADGNRPAWAADGRIRAAVYGAGLPRGLRPGDSWEKAEQVYDGSFADSLSLRLDEDDNIVELGLHSPYYDCAPEGCRTMREQHMFHYWIEHPEDAPDNWDPVTKDLDD